MRFQLLIYLTVMTMLASFLSFFHSDVSIRAQEPISRTGSTNTDLGTVPTVEAIPVLPNETVAQPDARDYGLDLDFFVQAVINGNPNQVVGVYIPETLALPIRQQPDNDNNFVSTEPEVITQFRAAERFRTIGLLAHNYLAGQRFYDIQPSEMVILIYGDGSLRYYQVSTVQKYQALSPNSPQSDFIDLSDPTSSRLTAGDVFNRIYTQGDRVVFQTCILNHGDPSWGRMFITATPLTIEPTSFLTPVQTSYGLQLF